MTRPDTTDDDADRDAIVAATTAEYEGKLVALEADKERMDWLQQQASLAGFTNTFLIIQYMRKPGITYENVIPCTLGFTLRENIDAARTRSPSVTL